MNAAPADGGGAAGTELSLKLWVVLNRAYRAVAEIDRESLAGRGLTPGEFAVLEALLHKGPLLLGELRRKVLVSSGGVTYLVDRLQEKGLVRRRMCPEDRRATYAELTEEGEELVLGIFPAHAGTLHRALGGLDAGEKRTAVELLKKLGLQAAERAPDDGS